MKVTIEEWTEKANKTFEGYDILFTLIQKTEDTIIDKIGEVRDAFLRVDERLKEFDSRLTKLEKDLKIPEIFRG